MIRNAEPPFRPDCKIPPVRVHIIHKDSCEFTDPLVDKITEEVPDAKITTEIGGKDSFELYINDKVVFSRAHLHTYPDADEMTELVFWAAKGKSFMHMYLCTFAEGGEPNMVVSDRKNTPLAKRVMLACVIS